MNEIEDDKKTKLEALNSLLAKLRSNIDFLSSLGFSEYQKNILFDINPHINHIQNDIKRVMDSVQAEIPEQKIKKGIHRSLGR